MTTPATHPIFLATVSAPTNIAVVKYWGKADEHYNTPINSSCSVTLHQDDLRAVTTVAVSKDFVQDRLWLNGIEVPTAATSRRFRACVDGVLALAPDKYHTDDDNNNKTVAIAQHEWPTLHVHVSSYNTFPTAAGLASSAAGYAALVAALVQLTGATETFPGEFSTLARQGSGSACRSLYGGLVAWHAGTADEQWRDSRAEQLADEASWPALRAVIAVVSDAQKDTASTAGMQASVKTSPLLAFRAAHVVPQRMQELTQAWRRRDFPVFGKITMQDSNQFHATCLDTYPPIFYMNDVSRQIIRIVTAYNDYAGEIRAAYTLDAGPNVVLYVLEPHRPVLAALLRHFFPASGLEEQNDEVLDPALVHAAEATGRVPRDGDVRHYYVTRPGPGPRVLDNDADGTIDPHTGLNRYQPSG